MLCRVSKRFKYCVAGERIILLDVQNARYLGLPPIREQMLFRLMDRRGHCDLADPGLQDLMLDGILEPTDYPQDLLRRPYIECPSSDVLDRPTRVFPLTAFLLALSWELWATTRLRLTPFSTVIGRLTIAREPVCALVGQPADRLMAVAAAFERTRLIFGRTDRCLVRSIAMFSLYRSMGIATKLVIGVRSDPFAAHCWIQREGQVLNDVAEHARTFTPIWVIG